MKSEYSAHRCANLEELDRLTRSICDHFFVDSVYAPMGFDVHVALDYNYGDDYPREHLNIENLRTMATKKEAHYRSYKKSEYLTAVEHYDYRSVGFTFGKKDGLQVSSYDKTVELKNYASKSGASVSKVDYIKYLHRDSNPGQNVYRVESRMPWSWLKSKKNITKYFYDNKDNFLKLAAQSFSKNVRFSYDQEKRINKFNPLWSRFIKTFHAGVFLDLNRFKIDNKSLEEKEIENKGRKLWTEFSTFISYKITYSKRIGLDDEQFIDDCFKDSSFLRALIDFKYSDIPQDVAFQEAEDYLMARYSEKDVAKILNEEDVEEQFRLDAQKFRFKDKKIPIYGQDGGSQNV